MFLCRRSLQCFKYNIKLTDASKKLIPTINKIETDCGFVLKGLRKSFTNQLYTDKMNAFISSRNRVLHSVAFLIEFVYCRECVHTNWTGLA